MNRAYPECKRCGNPTENGYCDTCDELEMLSRAAGRWYFVIIGCGGMMGLAILIYLFTTLR